MPHHHAGICGIEVKGSNSSNVEGRNIAQVHPILQIVNLDPVILGQNSYPPLVRQHLSVYNRATGGN